MVESEQLDMQAKMGMLQEELRRYIIELQFYDQEYMKVTCSYDAFSHIEDSTTSSKTDSTQVTVLVILPF